MNKLLADKGTPPQFQTIGRERSFHLLIRERGLGIHSVRFFLSPWLVAVAFLKCEKKKTIFFHLPLLGGPF